MTLLFDLAIETAMRMSEMFTLTLDQIDLDRRTIFLERTTNGDNRQVPLSRGSAGNREKLPVCRRNTLIYMRDFACPSHHLGRRENNVPSNVLPLALKRATIQCVADFVPYYVIRYYIPFQHIADARNPPV